MRIIATRDAKIRRIGFILFIVAPQAILPILFS